MISCMRTALNESTTLRQTERQESLDYYTAWVHQIKTPVSVMKMILESEDTEEHRELLAELFRIEQYVEMVLSYLRLGSSTSDYVFANMTSTRSFAKRSASMRRSSSAGNFVWSIPPQTSRF